MPKVKFKLTEQFDENILGTKILIPGEYRIVASSQINPGFYLIDPIDFKSVDILSYFSKHLIQISESSSVASISNNSKSYSVSKLKHIHLDDSNFERGCLNVNEDYFLANRVSSIISIYTRGDSYVKYHDGKVLEERLNEVMLLMMDEFDKESLKDSFFYRFTLGWIKFLTGDFGRAINYFKQALEFIPEGDGDFLNYICLEKILTSDLVRAKGLTLGNFAEIDVVAMLSPDPDATGDITDTTHALSSIIRNRKSISILHLRNYGGNELLESDLKKNISENCFIFILGHGNSKGIVVEAFPKITKYLNRSTLFNSIKGDEIDSSIIKNIVVFDFTCSNSHFEADEYPGFNYCYIRSSKEEYDATRAEAFCLGFLRSYDLNRDIKKSLRFGKAAVNLMGKEHDIIMSDDYW